MKLSVIVFFAFIAFASAKLAEPNGFWHREVIENLLKAFMVAKNDARTWQDKFDFIIIVFQHLSPAQKKDSISRFFSSCKFDLTVRKDETPELIPKFKTTVKSVVSAIHGDSGFNSYFQVFNLVNELVLKTGMRSVRDELRKLFHYLFTEASTPKHFIGEGGEKEMNCFLDELLKIFDGKTDKREAIPEMSREAANILKQIDEYSKETERPNLFSKFPK